MSSSTSLPPSNSDHHVHPWIMPTEEEVALELALIENPCNFLPLPADQDGWIHLNYCPILLLPPEIRTPIWHYLTPCSRASIRSTCKTFRSEIDTGLGLCIDLDERLFTLRDPLSTLPPSASCIRIWGSEQTHDYLSRLLYNSRLLSSITFAGPTEVAQVKKVLSRCPNLASITVTDHVTFDTRFLIPFKLRSVRKLHLGKREDRRFANIGNSAPTHWMVYSDLLANLGFPCLKCLRLEYTLPRELSSGSGYSAMFRIILKYLVAHKSVTELTLRLHKAVQLAGLQDAVAPPPPKPQPKLQPPPANVKVFANKFSNYSINFNAKSNLQNSLPKPQKTTHFLTLMPKELTALQTFTNFTSLVISTDSELAKIWEMVLQAQTHLEVLDFLNQGSDWLFFAKIVKNNRATLKIVRLRRLLPDDGPLEPLGRCDLGAFEFESCTRLQELFLSRFEDSTKEVCGRGRSGRGVAQNAPNQGLPFLDRSSSPFPELIRFPAIPTSLERLHIQGFTVKTDDLLTIPERMKGLKVLELQLLGYNHGKALSEISREQGSGDFAGNDDLEGKIWKNDAKTKTSSQIPKDISHDGFGVTPAVLMKILAKLRNLDTLFVEEFDNHRTHLGQPSDFAKALKKVNLIPGDGFLKSFGYFGVLVAENTPLSQIFRGIGNVGGGDSVMDSSGFLKFRKLEKMESKGFGKWDVRFNQYRQQYRTMMMEKKGGAGGKFVNSAIQQKLQNRPL